MNGRGRLFRFVQFEFPWALGPDEGRFAIREQTGELPNQVLVLRTLGAPERRRMRSRKRVREAEAQPAPEPVLTSRATLVDTAALSAAREAADWLAGADLDMLVDDAIARLNRVLHAQRIATADPYARGVSRAQALVTRVGYGDGEGVAEGRWDDARELAHDTGRQGGAERRSTALRPQERLAALLGGRDVALACEELTLRARADLDAGRQREAALQLRVALEAALAELEPWRDRPMLTQRLAALHEHREAVVAIAEAALRSGLADEQIAAVEEALLRVEAALRARVAGGLD